MTSSIKSVESVKSVEEEDVKDDPADPAGIYDSWFDEYRRAGAVITHDASRVDGETREGAEKVGMAKANDPRVSKRPE